MRSDVVPARPRTGFGHVLRARRLARNLGIEDVAAQLRLPVRIVEAMENEDRARLDATVFVRGRVGGYARLLDLPMEEVDAHFPPEPSMPSPQLHSAPVHGRRRWMQGLAAKQFVAVIAAAIALPMVALAAMHGRRHDAPAAVARAAMRNPTSVIALRDGEPIDLVPFRGADRARFALSSAGQPTPARD